MKQSITRLFTALKENQIDAAIITLKENRNYFSGFTGSSAVLLIHPEANYLITDFRYIEQAGRQCPDFRIIDAPGAKTAAFIKETCMSLGAERLWFEEDAVSYKEYISLAEGLKPLQLIPDNGIPSKLRILKTEDEVNNIKKAAKITDDGFSHILKHIRNGVTEKDIAFELEFFLRKNGSEGLAFPIIAASGKNGALPHAQPSNKPLENGDLLTLDFGCIVNGYCSDMTRTVALGEPSDILKKIYNITLEAQLKALDILAPGLTGKEVDKAARDHIGANGYADCFGHGLGHGVGLQVHEGPTLSQRGDTILEPGMIVTIEPGIYIPEVGGVRIEDLAVITEKGYNNLVTSNKDLIIL